MKKIFSLLSVLLLPVIAMASEADLKIPNLSHGQNSLLMLGFVICLLGLIFGLYQFVRVKKSEGSSIDVRCFKNYFRNL